MSELIDTGTKEFNRRHRIVPIKMRNSVMIRALDTTAVDRALLNNVIDPEQHSIVVAFGKDCYLANMLGPRASDYGRPMGNGSKHEVSTREAEAMQLVGRALDYLTQKGGHACRLAIYDMVMSDRDADTATLKAAVSILSDFYVKRYRGRA